MHKIPYFDQHRYAALFDQFLASEQNDLASSEIVLGESYFESPVKVVFEHVLLLHIKASGSLPCETVTDENDDLPDYEYYEHEREKGAKETVLFTSAAELLKKAIGKCAWYKAIDFEIASRQAQLTYANVIILNVNDLLGFSDE